jgi:hypothetical protein
MVHTIVSKISKNFSEGKKGDFFIFCISSQKLTTQLEAVRHERGDLKCREVKTKFLPKGIIVNRLFGDSHWQEIWKATYVPLWDRTQEAWLWTQISSAENDNAFSFVAEQQKWNSMVF